MAEANSPEHSPGLLTAIWRFWWVLVIGAILGLIVAGVVTSRIEERFETTTRFTVGSAINTSTDVRPAAIRANEHAAAEAARMRSAAVVEAAAAQLPNLTADEIRGWASVDVDDESLRALLTITAPNAQDAANVANAWRDAYQRESATAVMADALAALSSLDAQQAEIQADIDATTAQLDERREVIASQARQAGFANANELENNIRANVLSDAESAPVSYTHLTLPTICSV